MCKISKLLLIISDYVCQYQMCLPCVCVCLCARVWVYMWNSMSCLRSRLQQHADTLKKSARCGRQQWQRNRVRARTLSS